MKHLSLVVPEGEHAAWLGVAKGRGLSLTALVRERMNGPESDRFAPPSGRPELDEERLRLIIREEMQGEPQAPLEPRRDPDELVIPADLAKRLRALTPLDPLDLLARFVQASEAEKVRRTA